MEVLRLEYEGNFFDSAKGRTLNVSVGTVGTSTARSKFGSYGGNFTSGGIYYNVGSNPDLLPGLQDYCFESYCWINAIAADNGRHLCMGNVADGALWANFLVYNSGRLRIGIGNSSAGANIFLLETTNPVVTAQNWFHMALSREGSLYRLFYNGNLVASASQTTKTNLAFTSGCIGIGSQFNNGYGPWSPVTNTWFDRTILTIGKAKYTSNFIPE